MADLCFASAVDLAAGIRRGEYAPTEVVEAFLDRIAGRNDAINAYVTVCEERAREAARDAEEALDAGVAPGPLHGVPVAIKDLEAVAGVRTTFGSAPYADHVPEESEPFVERLEAAGAIVLGKTNTPEFGHKGTTDNVPFGPTSTPFAPGRNSGGSSGGSAAAVADGLAPIAQGSDGGGSIRIPSAWCGVYGIKPTYRRVPRKARPDGFSHTPFTDLGPHARTVEDAALMLDVMAGPHPSDPMSAPDDGTEFLAATREPLDDPSVAYSPDLDVFPIDEEVGEIVADAVGAFEGAGASVEDVTIDAGMTREELLASWMAGFEVGYAELAANKAEEGIEYLGRHREKTSPEFVELIEAGEEYGAVEYKRSDVGRTRFFEAVQSLFEAYDLLVTPTLAVPPVENAEEGQTLGPTEVNGEAVDPLVGWCLTYPFNMTGHPAASVPAGTTGDGLPVGLQIVGPRWDDATVLAASAAFERVRPWRDLYPPR